MDFTKRRWPALLVMLSATVVLGAPATASAVPTGFEESTAFSGLSQPTVVRFADDGRVFVAEQNGRIKVYDNLFDPTPTVAADLGSSVHSFWDRGLLGFAIDPQFPERPYLYVSYAYDAPIGGTPPTWGDGCPGIPGATGDGCVVSGRLAKLTVNANNQVTQPQQVLVEDWCQQYPSHSVGALAFGPDGALYMSGGDGASFNFADWGQDGDPLNPCGDPPNGVGGVQTSPTAEGGALRSQDLRTAGDPVSLDGSVIRVNPDTGAGAPGNPLAASADANARRIVAHGLRNPFRLTFRPGTSELWIGDVGWSTWEEINRLANPLASPVTNFGWPCREGAAALGGYSSLNICAGIAAQPSSTTNPHFAYRHSSALGACPAGGSSISGLAFYNGGSFPAAYDGALFFSDYSRRCIWVMRAGAGGIPDPATVETFHGPAIGPVDLVVGPGGDLFYADLSGGTIRRIRATNDNRAPEAVATASPTSGSAPLTVDFDGGDSSDPDPGDTLIHEWDLDGDGEFDDSASPTPSRTYTAPSTTVRLRVRDSRGVPDTSDPITITTGSTTAPVASIDTPAATTRWRPGQRIFFTGSATDAEDGDLTGSALSWSLDLRHCAPDNPNDCHTHHMEDYTGSGDFFDTVDHEYPSHFLLTLTARDSTGAVDTKTLRLDPDTVDLTFNSSPSGLALTVGGRTSQTPFTRTVIKGSANSLSTDTPQSSGGVAYDFSSWSDGGALSHNIVAPDAATSYTATFSAQPPPANPGLVAAFGFDELAGATVSDASGAANNGTILGATRSLAGRYGSALSFDGTNDWVTVADSASLDLTSAMTLEAWVRPATTNPTWRTILLKEQPGQLSYALYSHTDAGAPSGYIYTNTDLGTIGGSTLPANSWTHLAATYGGGALRLYINGTQVATRALTANIRTSNSPLRIGGNAVWPEWFNGLIDEVRVYNRALTPTQIQTDMNTAIGPPPPADTQAPTAPVGLTANGSLGQASLSWGASTDNVGVTRYNVHRGSSAGFTPSIGNRVAQVTGTTHTDTSLAPGTYYYRVVAEDAAENLSAPSEEAAAVVPGDTTSPAVSITAPVNGATVSGTVQVTGNASDNVGVAGVQFRLDGQPLGAEDTTAPYSASWNTTTASAGNHTLTAVARDAAGNTTTSGQIGVTVPGDTTSPAVSITAPVNGATVSGTVQVTGNASDNVGVAGVQFRLDGQPLGAEDTTAPYSASWNTTTASAGNHTLTAVARDAAGNTTTSGQIGVTVPGDTTSPAVSITAPVNGATVSGTVQVTGNASDNVGVAGVQFRLDGQPLGAEDTTAPYSASWNTTTASAGNHTLTAVARDAAGNTTTSGQIGVTVDNSVPPPPSGLVAAFGFDELAGATVSDASGAANNGTILGATRSLAGRYGSALSFDGTNDWVTVADSASLDLTSAMTLEAWVRPATTNPTWRTILLKEQPGQLSYALYSHTDAGAPSGYIYTNTDLGTIGGSTLPANSWTHLAATYGGGALRLYINGTQVATRALTANIRTSNSPLRIGGNAVWPEWFNGLIDEVRVYNRALTPTQIQTDMNTPVGP